MAAIPYRELTSETSPSTAGFAFEGGRAILQLAVDQEYVIDAITDLLGDVWRMKDGRLDRDLPKAHPQYPWLFARRISNVVGKQFVSKASKRPKLEAPSLDFYAAYAEYHLTVEFEPRPYAVLSNDRIFVSDTEWKDEAGADTTSRFTTEYRRFTEKEPVAQPELISGTQGQMAFMLGTPGAGPIYTKPHDVAFPGYPRMIYPKNMVKFRWYQVPAYYLDEPDSWIVKGVGKINQTTFMRYEPGSLIYYGYTSKIYTPCVPEMDDESETLEAQKLCDIEFIFEHTDRTITDPPSVSNPNWIVEGHNALPWLKDRKFYYAASKDDDAAKRVPTYLSFPFQLLFTDPAPLKDLP